MVLEIVAMCYDHFRHAKDLNGKAKPDSRAVVQLDEYVIDLPQKSPRLKAQK